MGRVVGKQERGMLKRENDKEENGGNEKTKNPKN